MPDRARATTWISFRPTDDLAAAAHDLVGVIRADPESVRGHTRLILRSVEWERRQHDRSVLLRGRDLEADERWQAEASVHASPTPTGLQLEYITASRRTTTRGLRFRLSTLVIALAVAIGLTVVALIERAHATQQSDLATARELAASSVAQQSKDSELSLLLAVDSVNERRTDAGERALRQAIADSRIRLTINVGSRRKPVDSVLFTPDGRRVVTHGSDGTLRVFDAARGTLSRHVARARCHVTRHAGVQPRREPLPHRRCGGRRRSGTPAACDAVIESRGTHFWSSARRAARCAERRSIPTELVSSPRTSTEPCASGMPSTAAPRSSTFHPQGRCRRRCSARTARGSWR